MFNVFFFVRVGGSVCIFISLYVFIAFCSYCKPLHQGQPVGRKRWVFKYNKQRSNKINHFALHLLFHQLLSPDGGLSKTLLFPTLNIPPPPHYLLSTQPMVNSENKKPNQDSSFRAISCWPDFASFPSPDNWPGCKTRPHPPPSIVLIYFSD